MKVSGSERWRIKQLFWLRATYLDIEPKLFRFEAAMKEPAKKKIFGAKPCSDSTPSGMQPGHRDAKYTGDLSSSPKPYALHVEQREAAGVFEEQRANGVSSAA
jgi:hypothetical protein